MRNIYRIFFATVAAAATFIQGCGCHDHKYYPPAESNYTVTGTAGKGILRNFQVAAHRFNGGMLDPSPIATTTTSDLGVYSLPVPRTYLDQPLLLRVTPRASGSVMTCDLSAGCGDGVDFGEDLPVTDSEFQLDTVVPSTQDNSVANITLLTNLAAQLVQDALASGTSMASIQAAINEANSRIANRFGLTGNLATLPVIDLTNRAAVSAALNAGNSVYLQYAAINAAIIQAVRADGNNASSFVAALNAFVNYFGLEGIAGNTLDPTETSYADILAAAQSILVRVQELDPQAPLNLAALLQSLLVEQQLAESEEPDNYDQGTPSTGANDTDLQKAKNMVSDLVDFAASVGESSLEGGLDVATVSEEFAMQLDAAKMTTSVQADYLLNALALAAAAVDDANRAYENNNSLEFYTSTTGIGVSISVSGDEPTFSIDDEISVTTKSGTAQVDVTLEAQNGLTITETSGQTGSTIEVDGDYRITGKAVSSELELEIKNGSHVMVTDLLHQEPVAGGATQSADAFDLRLIVTLAQKLVQGSDPLSLDGSLAVTLADVQTEDTANENTELTLGNISLNFAGKVSNTTGESFNFSLSLSGDATGVSFVDGLGGDSETAENYTDISGSLAFTAQLTGIPSVVSVIYNLERTGLESGNNSLVIKYPGKLFRFHVAVEDGEPVNPLTVSNQDAAILTLNETEKDGESNLNGNIKVNGKTQAVIEERNTIIITFDDGEIRSL